MLIGYGTSQQRGYWDMLEAWMVVLWVARGMVALNGVQWQILLI
jgi:hypothetical protein